MKRRNAHKRRRRNSLRRTPERDGKGPIGLTPRMLSDKQLVSMVETLSFGSVGCSFLRALGIKPIDLLQPKEPECPTA